MPWSWVTFEALTHDPPYCADCSGHFLKRALSESCTWRPPYCPKSPSQPRAWSVEGINVESVYNAGEAIRSGEAGLRELYARDPRGLVAIGPLYAYVAKPEGLRETSPPTSDPRKAGGRHRAHCGPKYT